ncbi:hypothetical protein SD70_30870 [Gordoniibacillus kamchatkensis]|uniref:DUF92 domain-containing protein n=1 Tax=Gordoniibacillus kamchatkensis TaxID=1590651 RepID=A0ABR5A9P4_9BACL|nr:hypothetical protein SD70_30870 [Paenibacillus sp. VKM B-2647]
MPRSRSWRSSRSPPGSPEALADSWLGAAWQAMRRCTVCGREVERAAHCSRPTVHARGVPWLGNDAVNLLSSAAGGIVAVLLALAFGL